MWRDRAACASADTTLFDPIEGRGGNLSAEIADRVQAAFDWCDTCPVRRPCAAEAESEGYSGVWGGQMLVLGHPTTVSVLKRKPRPVSPCGTEQAWRRHRDAKQACELCTIQHDTRKALQAKARTEASRRRRFMGVA